MDSMAALVMLTLVPPWSTGPVVAKRAIYSAIYVNSFWRKGGQCVGAETINSVLSTSWSRISDVCQGLTSPLLMLAGILRCQFTRFRYTYGPKARDNQERGQGVQLHPNSRHGHSRHPLPGTVPHRRVLLHLLDGIMYSSHPLTRAHPKHFSTSPSPANHPHPRPRTPAP